MTKPKTVPYILLTKDGICLTPTGAEYFQRIERALKEIAAHARTEHSLLPELDGNCAEDMIRVARRALRKRRVRQ